MKLCSETLSARLTYHDCERVRPGRARLLRRAAECASQEHASSGSPTGVLSSSTAVTATCLPSRHQQLQLVFHVGLEPNKRHVQPGTGKLACSSVPCLPLLLDIRVPPLSLYFRNSGVRQQPQGVLHWSPRHSCNFCRPYSCRGPILWRSVMMLPVAKLRKEALGNTSCTDRAPTYSIKNPNPNQYHPTLSNASTVEAMRRRGLGQKS